MDAVWYKEAVVVVVESVVPHVWWIKIRRDTLGVSNPSPSPNHRVQDSSTGKKKKPLPLAIKTCGGWGNRGNCWIFTALRAHTVLNHMHTPGQQLEGCQLHTESG